MKKLIIVLVLLLTASQSLQAQTWAEWFKQKKTQKKYLLQQIAALKVYIEYAQKGYKIADKGLKTIGNLTGGEFNLHGNYFNSLKEVTPEIKQYYKVADIIAMQAKVMQEYKKIKGQVTQSDEFSADEKAYINRVFTRLLDDCNSTLDDLLTVTTSGTLEMEDSQRMARVDQLHLDMQGQYTFCKAFSRDIKSFAANRIHDSQEIHNSRAMHGIENQEP